MSVIKKETIDVRRVGTALIGGDFTGNARGTNAIDVQTTRGAATQVASSLRSITIGQNNTASNVYAGYGDHIAIGYNNTVSGYYGEHTAVGNNNTISAYQKSTIIGSHNSVTENLCTAVGYNNSVSDQESTAMGVGNIASNSKCTAIGNANTSSGYQSTTAGYDNTASSYNCTAIGSICTASGEWATAIGYRAEARIGRTSNICGPQIIRKDDGEAAANAFESYCGVEDILVSKEVDMKAVADHTITLPANCHFWLNETGIIATNIANLVAQPTVRYGITGDLDKHGAAAATTALTATLKREIETPLVPEDGETSLTGGVTIAANADTFNGRFYWKGMLIEDE